MAAALASGALLTVAGTAWGAFVTEPGSPYPTGGDPYTVNVADFNGDGRPDVATINGTSGNVSVYLRQAGGGFAQEAGSPFAAGNGPSNAAVGDFNGDGRPDLAVADYTGATVTVLLRQPSGFAQEGTAIPVSANASAIAAGDFTGDGRPDLAVSREGSGQVLILVRNAANDGFTAGRVVATGPTPGPIAVGLFNADSVLDLAVINKGNNTLTIALGNGDGSFASPEPTVPTGAGPYGLVAADFTGDGRSDLAVTNYTSGSVSVFDRTATGFAEEAGSPVAVSPSAASITLGDFDADGRADLAIAANSGAVDVLRRNAGGGFTRDPAVSLPGSQNGIGAADFDGDGRADLAVTGILASSALNILLNPAPATPAPTPTPTATPTPLPPPVAGKTVNAARKSGQVRFRRPGSKKFVTLTADAQIPVGSVIDTRKGRITITAAQGKGKTASADFYAGLFKLTQTRGAKPATTLSLTEKLSCPKRKRASAAAKAKKQKWRRLWGSGHGRFTTKGAYSAATVRGTKWLVQDTCTSTLTRVTSGVVAVRDRVKHKTIVLRKGKRYVAHRRTR